LNVQLPKGAKTMLEIEFIDKCIELFNNGKINGVELAELLLNEGAK
jgi:hypothetical protein